MELTRTRPSVMILKASMTMESSRSSRSWKITAHLTSDEEGVGEELELARNQENRLGDDALDKGEGEVLMEFQLFTKLVMELRIMIWKAICRHPQVIGVKSSWSNQSETNDAGRLSRMFMASFAPAPRSIKRHISATTAHSQALYINHEFREVALTFYLP